MSIIKAVIEEIINYNGNVKEYNFRADNGCFLLPNRYEVYCYGSNGAVTISYAHKRCWSFERCWSFGNYNVKRRYVK